MPDTIGPARLLEQIAEDNPRAIVAIWQTADGEWVTGKVVSGKVENNTAFPGQGTPVEMNP